MDKQSSTDSLFAGALKFKEQDFLEHKELFADLKRNQNPHTLFIGCSDSRLVPNLITGTKPGELFAIRNIANIVPPYRQSTEFLATTSAIEYALCELLVENVIICGHSHCGGCKALFESEEHFIQMPNVKNWLRLLDDVKFEVQAQISSSKYDPSELLELRGWLCEQINIEHQVRNFFTYPQVRKRYLAGKLRVFGWHYIIESGEIYSYDFTKREFILIDKKPSDV